MSHPETVPVEQVDREAAADYLSEYLAWDEHETQKVRNGHRDWLVTVQAFARHRVAILGESA